MSLREMPNGQFVDIADGTPPEVLAKIEAQYPATQQQSSTSDSSTFNATPWVSSKDQAQQAGDSEQYNDSGIPIVSDIARIASAGVHGATGHLDDLATSAFKAGTQGVANAILTGDTGEIGRSFQNARDAARQYRANMAAQHPIESTVGDIGGTILGSLLTPELGIADAIGQGASRLATGAAARVGAGGVVPAVASAAAKVADNPFVKFVTPTLKGTVAGAAYGGTTGLADSIDQGNPVGDTLRSAELGALGGAVGGTAAHAVGGVGNILGNRSVDNTANVAYGHIADALDQSYNSATKKAITPEEIASAVEGANKAGSATNVGDVVPSLQGMTADLSKENKLYGGALQSQAADRMATAPDRYNTQLNNALDISPNEPSAYGLGKAIKQDLKTSASDPTTGYDAMLKQNVWSPELEDFFSKPTPVTQDALRNAVTMVRNERDPITGLAQDPHQLVPLLKKAGIDPASVGLTDPAAAQTSSILQASGRPYPAAATAAGGPATAKVPSMFAMDAVKRNLNAIADSAFNGSSTNAGRIGTAANNEQKLLKGLLTDAHPGYKALVGNQSNLYERADSLQHGTDFINAMRNGKAEEWLDNAKSNPNLNKDDLKVGVADQLRNIPGGAAGLQRILQTPEQKAALSWVVDDPAKVDNLSNFLRYEQRAASTDTAATSGLPGGTLNNQSNIDNPAPYIIGEVARGLPFGAPSGVLRGINAIKTVAGGGLTSNVKAKLASILSGDGQDLASGIENAKAYRDAQVALRLKSAKALGAGTVAATQFGR